MKKIKFTRSRLFSILAVLPVLAIAFITGLSAVLNENQILFEVLSRNPWPGTKSSGFYVDSQGRIFSFEATQTLLHRWFSDAGDPPYLASKLYRRYGLVNKQIGQVDKTTLQRMTMFLEAMKFDVSSKPHLTGCNDFGIVSFTAFQYDSQTQLHTPIRLFVAGDVAEKNTSEEGQTLAAWLKNLASEYGHNFQYKLTSCGPE